MITARIHRALTRMKRCRRLLPKSAKDRVIGKKNWLFIGEAEAGQRSAVLFTIIEACRSRGIDPQSYLRDVLTRLPTMTNWQIKDVTRAAWAKARDMSPNARPRSDPSSNATSNLRCLA